MNKRTKYIPVKATDLVRKLSYYLNLVEKGSTLLIIRRSLVVAELKPANYGEEVTIEKGGAK